MGGPFSIWTADGVLDALDAVPDDERAPRARGLDDLPRPATTPHCWRVLVPVEALAGRHVP
jgi:hypothetical protein